MRNVVAWLLLGVSIVLAQDPFVVNFPAQLKEYLALSDDQVVRMSTATGQVFTLQRPKYERQTQLQTEIAAETAKTVPDATTVGTRYAELESIRRALDTLQKSLVSQMQAILGANQRAKLAVLEQSLILYPISSSAVSYYLLSSAPDGPLAKLGIDKSSGPKARLAAAFPRAESFPPIYFPAELQKYLALSDDQIVRMDTVSAQVYTLQDPKLTRRSELQLEISVETAKPAPDPEVLGSAYVELELIRRQLDALQESLIAQTQAILDADQKGKLATLRKGFFLISTACDAVSQNLMNESASNAGSNDQPPSNGSRIILFPTAPGPPVCSAPGKLNQFVFIPAQP